MSDVPAKKRGRAEAEFTQPVKEGLAAEAGYRCANPACLAPTHAAGSTGIGVGKVGQAAHISAAAEGFARWQPGMDPKERRSAANGIWLCDTHAREIDVDEERFTMALLHGWKRRARQRALSSRGIPRSAAPSEPRSLIRHTAWLGDRDQGELHRFVSQFLADTGAHFLWSKREHDAVRMALYELILNAVTHANAERLHLRARGHRIDLVYAGADFNPNKLLATAGRGGAQSMAHVREEFGDSLSITYTHNGSVATIRLIDVSTAGPNQPCGVLTGDLHPGWEVMYRNCETIHVFMGGPMSFSDVTKLDEQFANLTPKQRVVLHGLSAPLGDFARERMKHVSVAPR